VLGLAAHSTSPSHFTERRDAMSVPAQVVAADPCAARAIEEFGAQYLTREFVAAADARFLPDQMGIGVVFGAGG
jgi:hypothetical protein